MWLRRGQPPRRPSGKRCPETAINRQKELGILESLWGRVDGSERGLPQCPPLLVLKIGGLLAAEFQSNPAELIYAANYLVAVHSCILQN